VKASDQEYLIILVFTDFGCSVPADRLSAPQRDLQRIDFMDCADIQIPLHVRNDDVFGVVAVPKKYCKHWDDG
jgi:hypothetical protein